MSAITRHHSAATTGIGVLAALYAVTFLSGALLRLGVRVPLGFMVLSEPRIVPATIVEGLCGLVLVIGAYAVFARKSRAWMAAVVAHAFALGGRLARHGGAGRGSRRMTTEWLGDQEIG